MIPIYGQGFFHLSLEGRLWYTIIFDYYDEKGEYHSLVKSGSRALREELENLRSNMQKLMDEERVIINGAQVRPVVMESFIEVRGDKTRPSIVFITRMDFDIVSGRNVYENFYEPTVAEYDYTVTWIAPPCVKFTSYEGPGRYRLKGNILRIEVEAGRSIDGYESIVFDTSTCGTPYSHSSP
ncbi:hypothetical protein [Stetteria hydrogenophila]